MVALVRDVAEQVPDAFATLRARAAAEGIEHPILARMQDAISGQVRYCLARLEADVEAGLP